jgi:hypothetical protein
MRSSVSSRKLARFSTYLPFCAALAAAGASAACGSNNGAPGGGPSDGSTDGTLPGDSGGSLLEDGGCSTSADCNGGVCIAASGTCCSSAAAICGTGCCAQGSVCLFNQCVVPGGPCQSSSDCSPGQYCETALGSDDAGAPVDASCTQAFPITGRCLPLPVTCADDGGAGDDAGDGGCTPSCQYHPTNTGNLSAVVEWTWGPTATAEPNQTDVWSTPTVGRMYDTNCDGKIDNLDSPVIVFVSGDVGATCCGCNGATPSTCENGILRMLNGSNGKEVWTLTKASATSVGFVGSAPALGDVDKDGVMDIVAMTGEGYIVLIDHLGNVTRTSDKPYPHTTALDAGQGTGWGGGIAIADMDLDGFAEITFGDTVWTTTNGAITRVFVGAGGTGGGGNEETSAISDIDLNPDGHLELVAGNTAYSIHAGVWGTLWTNANLPNGFPAVADFNQDGKPDVALVGYPTGDTTTGNVWILDGATGAIELGPVPLPYTAGYGNHGGPPTVADFDGDGKPEIGIAGGTFYTVLKPDYAASTIDVLWKMGNHDFSSSVTGSTVFDFEGDGVPEVVYADECWLWVFDGPTGAVRLAWPHSSFTGTEASMLADINGDGHAEMLIVSNGIDPGPSGWKCTGYEADAGLTINGQTWTPGPVANGSYRGLIALGDSANSWVGTRTLWTEHTYHVTNICDDTDNACTGANTYGSIPTPETMNWTLPWLNDFRQNVQDQGIFNAPDALVALSADCTSPVVAHVEVRNIGQSGLPSGVNVGVFASGAQVAEVTTTYALLPGQTQEIDVTLPASVSQTTTLYAQVLIDPAHPTFHECTTANNTSPSVTPTCVK